jgi:nitroreductase/NAD-dependent dihydropyrimidine dehydrogenase PreA subunit
LILVDRERCTACGTCAEVCHTRCMSVTDDSVDIEHALCSTCGQCVAICPPGALSWEGNEPRELETAKMPGYESMLELLKARRTTRCYRDEPVPPEELEKVLRTARLAPTNVYDFEYFVITDRRVIRELEEICLRWVRMVSRLVYGWPLFNLWKRLTPAVNDIDRLKAKRTKGRSSMFHGAPVMVLLTAHRWIAHAEASAQYSMYNMILSAQALGLGTCISGAGRMFLSRSRKAKDLLGIPEDKTIFGVLLIGVPDVKWKRSVEGYLPDVHRIE